MLDKTKMGYSEQDTADKGAMSLSLLKFMRQASLPAPIATTVFDYGVWERILRAVGELQRVGPGARLH